MAQETVADEIIAARFKGYRHGAWKFGQILLCNFHRRFVILEIKLGLYPRCNSGSFRLALAAPLPLLIFFCPLRTGERGAALLLGEPHLIGKCGMHLFGLRLAEGDQTLICRDGIEEGIGSGPIGER